MISRPSRTLVFLFNDTATTEIYTLSLHDALPVPALLLMIGVYCGGVFGGSITGILFNIPGDPMNVPTTWEGYQLSQQGRTQYALGLAIMSSAVGGLVSALFLAFFAPPFARFALTLSSVEFFSVVVFGLAGVSVLNQSSLPAAL